MEKNEFSKKTKNEIGNSYGKLTVINFAYAKRENKKSTKAYWNCKCECGNFSVYSGDQLRQKKVVSCGCFKKSNFDLINKKRKENAIYSKHLGAHRSWRHMIARCTNKKSIAFKKYGEAGIEVCKRWINFENFLLDMGDPVPGMTIDRINNDFGYYPENCRWADKATQSRNTKNTKLNYELAVEIRVKLKNGSQKQELAEFYNVSVSTISAIKTMQNWKEKSFIQLPKTKDLIEYRGTKQHPKLIGGAK